MKIFFVHMENQGILAYEVQRPKGSLEVFLEHSLATCISNTKYRVSSTANEHSWWSASKFILLCYISMYS